MLNGFYTRKTNDFLEKAFRLLEDTLLCKDGELFVVRYNGSSKSYYLTDFNQESYEGIIDNKKIIEECKLAIESNSDSITYHREKYSFDLKIYDTYKDEYSKRHDTLEIKNNEFSFNLGEVQVCKNETDWLDAVRISIDNANHCIDDDCDKTCEGHALIDKTWFYDNFLKLTNYSNESEFFSSYTYEDSKKIVNEALKNYKLLKMKFNTECIKLIFNV